MLWKETKCKIVPTLYYLLCKKKEGVRKYKCALRGGVQILLNSFFEYIRELIS